MIQLVTQVRSPWTEKACSQWAESAVMSDQTKRGRMSLPLMGQSVTRRGRLRKFDSIDGMSHQLDTMFP
jgi:hypothetical protein